MSLCDQMSIFGQISAHRPVTLNLLFDLELLSSKIVFILGSNSQKCNFTSTVLR